MGGVPMHREAPLQAGPRRCGVCQSKQGLIGPGTEKAALLSPITAHRLCPQVDGGLRELRVGRHTNLSSTYNTSGTERGSSVAWHKNP